MRSLLEDLGVPLQPGVPARHQPYRSVRPHAETAAGLAQCSYPGGGVQGAMKRLHIGMVCDEYPPVPHGGIGSVVCDLAEGMANRDHTVTVVGSYPAEKRETMPNHEEYRNNVR